jgi:hypothetical protein
LYYSFVWYAWDPWEIHAKCSWNFLRRVTFQTPRRRWRVAIQVYGQEINCEGVELTHMPQDRGRSHCEHGNKPWEWNGMDSYASG